jgi:predicted dehydrogenase
VIAQGESDGRHNSVRPDRRQCQRDRSHLPAVQASPNVELTAVCTTKADSAEAARQAYGARLAFDDYRKMVSSPEIDAVHAAPPPGRSD